MEIEKTILGYLEAIYSLSNEQKIEILKILQSMGDEKKKKALVTVFKRYEAFEKNIRTLKKDLKFTFNIIEEMIEEQVDNKEFDEMLNLA